MRVCLVATEFPDMGPYGGFGVLTKDIALGLVKCGIDVFVAMPRRTDRQRPVEIFDGVTIVSYPSPLYIGLRKALPYAGVFRMIDADIYHSEEPSLGTAIAQRALPHRKHIVTFQDPRELEDWKQEWAGRRIGRLRARGFWYLYQHVIGRAARRADQRYCQAKCIVEKTTRMYRLKDRPGFLPNPLTLGPSVAEKALEPTVCYLGRWDARKRPDMFLDLARAFPDVRFIFAGACLNDAGKDARIREAAGTLQNVECPGWIGAAERAAILDRAWILINTSTRECLPVSYLEAGGRRCAILSHCNADDFASSFGFWAQRGDLADYIDGLRFLLTGDRWQARGERAFEYVSATHEYDRVIDQHVDVYRRIIAQ
jgi:glycosyltransferase involved in cell wall biosynthesis